MSFGAGPFGLGPFGVPAAALPSENPSALSSSRKFNGVTRRYEINDEGGFDEMRDTAQRVLLLTSFGIGKPPKFIDDRGLAAIEQSIRSSLDVLTSGKEPAIELQAVSVARASAGTVKIAITFRDLTTNEVQTVEP